MSVRTAVLAALLSLPALAQTTIHAPVAIQPKGNAPAEMDKLKDLAGTWTCAGKGLAAPSLKLAARELKAKLTITKDAEGYWQSLRWEEEKSRSNPRPLRAVGNWGWEPTAKAYLATWFDNAGWGARLATSPGPFEGTWTWQGPLVLAEGKRAIARQTFGLKDKALALTFELEIVGGEKMVLWEAMGCKRAGP